MIDDTKDTSTDSQFELQLQTINCIGDKMSKTPVHCKKRPRCGHRSTTRADDGDKRSLMESDESLSEYIQLNQNQPAPPQNRQQQQQQQQPQQLLQTINCIGDKMSSKRTVHNKIWPQCGHRLTTTTTRADDGDKRSLMESEEFLSEHVQLIQKQPASPQQQQQQQPQQQPQQQRKKYLELDDSCIKIVTTPTKQGKIVYDARRTPISIAWVGRWPKNACLWLWRKKSHFVVATVSFLVGTYFEDYCHCLYTEADVN